MTGPHTTVTGAISILFEGQPRIINQPLTDYISILPRYCSMNMNKEKRSPLDAAAYRITKLFRALGKVAGTLSACCDQLVLAVQRLRPQPDRSTGTSLTTVAKGYKGRPSFHTPVLVTTPSRLCAELVFMGSHFPTFDIDIDIDDP
jgi:hypothetical protein